MFKTGFCLTVLLCPYVSILSAAVCDDVDDVACKRLSRVSDVCNDICFAKYCPRTCGKCPIKCYNCTAQPTADACNTTSVCSSSAHKCIIMETLNSLSLSYKSTCATTDVCNLLFGGHSRNVRGQCCNHDLCNDEIPHPRRAATPQQTQAMLNANLELFKECHEIDQTACQIMKQKINGMCNEACLLQACPQTCGKCATCYSCDLVSHPRNCTNTTVCDPDEQCYSMKHFSTAGGYAYKMGCLKTQACLGLRTTFSNIFGRRRDKIELPLDGDCCQGDLCNNVVLRHSTTSTTTTTTATTTTTTSTTTTPKPTRDPLGCTYSSSSHCPDTHRQISNKCIMASNKPLNFTEAQKYCYYHCSTLAEGIDVRHIYAIQQYLLGHFRQLINTGNTEYVYVGAIDRHHDGVFTWIISGNLAAKPVGLEYNHYCGLFVYSTGVIKPVSCSESYYALCEAPLK